MNTDIGPVSYGRDTGEQFQKPFSEATAQKLDQAGESILTFGISCRESYTRRDSHFCFTVHKMITDAHARTKALLTEHKADVEKVAQLLLEKEVITREDMRTMLGRRPFKTADEMDAYIESKLDREMGKDVKAPNDTPEL